MIELLLVIAIIGVIVWFVTSLPMPAPFKNAIYALAVILLLVYILSWFGFVDVASLRRR